MTKPFCVRCEGEGSVSTGIAEMGNVQCRRCDGSGYEPDKMQVDVDTVGVSLRDGDVYVEGHTLPGLPGRVPLYDDTGGERVLVGIADIAASGRVHAQVMSPSTKKRMREALGRGQKPSGFSVGTAPGKG